jgi:hypothetical protein
MMLGDGSFRAGTGWCGLRGMRVGHEIGGRRQMQLCPVGGFFGSSSRSIMIMLIVLLTFPTLHLQQAFPRECRLLHLLLLF